jgi:hypothetical protein
MRQSNKRQSNKQNKRQSNRRQSNRRQSNRRQSNKQNKRQQQNGGDGQMGHTVMTESYLGRPAIGFSELQNSPQTQEQVNAMKGGDAVASTGHWNQAPTGWENAPNSCQETLPGDVKLGGGKRRQSNRRQSNRKSNKKSNRRQQNKRQQNRKQSNRKQNRRQSNRRQ